MFVLDTDHISILQHPGSERAQELRARMRGEVDQIVTTAVTVHEQFRSWLALINRYRDVRRQVTYYERLVAANRFFCDWTVLPFDDAAADQFDDLRAQRIRIATMDLKIASICLVNAATLLSGNLRDFEQVPGLVVEDWLQG